MREKLPVNRTSIAHEFSIGGTQAIAILGLYPDGRPGELFVKIAKEGSTIRGLVDGWATMVSIALQSGADLDLILRKAEDTRFEPSGFTGNTEIPFATSVFDYLAKWVRSKSVVQS